ncbi:MAG: ribosome maturation factor RimM [Bauldia sp.]|nr:ribosome maturation factor RimM [Bauldia sp.]
MGTGPRAPAMTPGKRVIVARIGAAHGIRGEVRVKTFTEDPLSVGDYGALHAHDGRSFEIETLRPAGGADASMLVVTLSGVRDRNAAEALNGVELSIDRALLPATAEDEFYAADLVGLRAETPEGEPVGKVRAVVNYGAGDIVEILPASGTTILVPFSKAAVPEVDLTAGRIVVIPPVFDEETAT